MPSQTPFFKFELPIKLAGRQIRPPDLQSDTGRLAGDGLGDGGIQKEKTDAVSTMLRMHRDIEHVAFVCDQPSA